MCKLYNHISIFFLGGGGDKHDLRELSKNCFSLSELLGFIPLYLGSGTFTKHSFSD
jgi:hypothetical protein